MFSYGLLYMDTPVLARLVETCIHQLCLDTGCSLEDTPRAIADRDK